MMKHTMVISSSFELATSHPRFKSVRIEYYLAREAEAALAERDARIAERDEEIKRLRKVVDAALELEYVLRTPEGRADVDSFTAQPIRLALADMGIDLLEDEDAGR